MNNNSDRQILTLVSIVLTMLVLMLLIGVVLLGQHMIMTNPEIYKASTRVEASLTHLSMETSAEKSTK